MKSLVKRSQGRNTRLAYGFKYGAFLLLFLFSVYITGCGASDNNATTTDMTNPAPTVTIDLRDMNKVLPTPTEPPLWCGAWATQTSPVFTNNGNFNIGVYGKFTQNVKGNPAGIDQASASATVFWPDGSTESHTDMTTADGLAVFDISLNNKAFAINKLTLITINFTKPGIGNCMVDTSRAAFFTVMPKPKNKNGKNNNGNNDNNGNNNNGNGNNNNGNGNNDNNNNNNNGNGNNGNNGNGNNFNGNGGNNGNNNNGN